MIATKTHCLTADRKTVVDETDPSAAFLLVSKGCQIEDRIAAKYGLLKPEAEEVKPEVKETRAVKPEKITKR